MMFNAWIEPTISIFGLEIAWYAICIMIGIILAVVAGVKEGKKLGIPSDDVYWGVIIIVPCAIIGARLWYILFNLDQGWTFKRIIGLEGGLAGLAIQGGLIAALIAIIIYCKKKEMSLFRVLDIVAPGFLIGQICGRFGNFCNHELYGPIVENPAFLKAIPILGENMFINGAYRHPAFLYEAALNLVGLIIILVLRRKLKKLESGDLMGFYLIWYGIVRIITESVRSKSGANEILMAGPIPVSILLSIIFIVCGISYLIVKRFVFARKNYQEILAEIADKKIDTILFDLDGTLLDTKPLIDRSFIHTFNHFRPDYELSDAELDSFFGPTLYQTFSKYGKDEAEIEAMIAYYREFNIANHDDIVKAMPGAKDVVAALHKKGYRLGVVSSKKTDLVRHGLELFGLLDKMDVIIGADEVSNHKPAPDGILLAIKKLKEMELNENNESKEKIDIIKNFFKTKKKSVNRVAYVGDTLNDMMAAEAAGVIKIGCLYIKNPEIMLEANVDYAIEKLSDLLKICVE